MKKIIAVASAVVLIAVTAPLLAKQNLPGVHRLSHHTRAQKGNRPVDVNTADAKTLASLKGVGPKKAKAIVEYRQKHGNFKSPQDLAAVPGLGKKAVACIVQKNPGRLLTNP